MPPDNRFHIWDWILTQHNKKMERDHGRISLKLLETICIKQTRELCVKKLTTIYIRENSCTFCKVPNRIKAVNILWTHPYSWVAGMAEDLPWHLHAYRIFIDCTFNKIKVAPLGIIYCCFTMCSLTAHFRVAVSIELVHCIWIAVGFVIDVALAPCTGT